jgi:hypothetical protein
MKPGDRDPCRPEGDRGDVPRHEQMELFVGKAGRSPDELRAAIAAHTRGPVQLTITRNRVMLASVRFEGQTARVRLHEAFLGASEAVVRAVGEYVESRSRRAWQVVGAYVRTIAPAPRAAPIRLHTCGSVYDLQALRDRVNRQYFSGRLRCPIGWGRSAQRRGRSRSRSIRFGCYVRAHNLVRINPLLDDARVPAAFVEYIVFHEMLHAAVPSEAGRRWKHHTPAFRRLERQFPDLPHMQKLAGDLVRKLV